MKLRPPRRVFVISLASSLVCFWIVLLIFLRNPVLIRGASIADEIQADSGRLKADVHFLASMKPQRHAKEPKQMWAAERYIRQQLEESGYQVRLQEVPSEDATYHNVIARYGDPEAKQLTVIGAHYDVCGDENPGADDNASGIAGLLELARLTARTKPTLHRAIEFVAFSLEEPPYFGGGDMGSAVHARALKASGIQVRLMVSLEMLGYFSDEPWSQTFVMPFLYALYPAVGDFIAVVGNTADRHETRAFKRAMQGNSLVRTYSINAPSAIPGVDFSDHRNYWAEDWPALMVTDTAFLRNTQYHKSGDTADRLNYEKMAQVVRGVYAGMIDSAGAE